MPIWGPDPTPIDTIGLQGPFLVSRFLERCVPNSLQNPNAARWSAQSRGMPFNSSLTVRMRGCRPIRGHETPASKG